MKHVRARMAAAAAARLAAVGAFLDAAAPRSQLVLIGQTRSALAELSAQRTMQRGASFGIHKKTLSGLAAEVAMIPLAESGRTIGPRLALDLLLGRVVLELLRDRQLGVLGASSEASRLAVALTPGFVPALSRTFFELDLAMGEARTDPLTRLAELGPLSAEVAALYRRYREEVARQALATRGDVLRLAAFHVGTSPFAGLDVALVDARLTSTAERMFAAALFRQATRVLVVLPTGDDQTAHSLREMGIVVQREPEANGDPMSAFRARLFDSDSEVAPPPPGTVTVQSAPGDALEAVEVARHVLAEARRGVPFSEIAVVLRRGERYATHLISAFARAEIPTQLDSGARRAHPSGRAFLALLACRRERGSGRRLIEYLSTGELPAFAARETEVLPDDDTLGRFGEGESERPAAATAPAPRVEVRLPLRKWQRVLGEIGLSHAGDGASIAAYLGRRLSFARRVLLDKQVSASLAGSDLPAAERIEGELLELTAIETHLGPVLQALDAILARAPLEQQVAALADLARAALRRPEPVLALLAELAPLPRSTVAVGIDELVTLLESRLTTLERPQVGEGVGRVLVTISEGIRGRCRRVIIMPGLAERVVPEQPREDPLLLDEVRAELPLWLLTLSDKAADERLALTLAAGAASERLHLTFPRVESETGRARVPSFYALEATRALSGELSALHAFERAARPPSRMSATWPSPFSAALAIDETEYALATIRALKSESAALARGRARFLVEHHIHLERALRARFRRHGLGSFDVNDGFVAIDPHVKRALLRRGLREIAYSPSTLQAFAACPYRFYLKAMMRLAPRPEMTEIDRLDASQRGQLYHRCQAKLASALIATALDPSNPETKAEVAAMVNGVVDEVAREERERFETVVGRVFDQQMEGVRLDLMGWADEQIAQADGFRPLRAELGFGLDDTKQEAVRIRGRYLIKGAIDAVEMAEGGKLRITDYKTGRLPDELVKGTPAVGGGEMLQPLLYAMVVNAIRGRELPAASEVVASRLYYATRRGGYRAVEIAFAADNEDRALGVLETIDQSIRRGVFFAMPKEGACRQCAYRPVCGPNEEVRTGQKQAKKQDMALYKALVQLRGTP